MSEPAVKRPMVDLDEFERRLRRPAAPQGQDDPLAELARLVGGHDDPFKAVFDQDRVQPQAASRLTQPNFRSVAPELPFAEPFAADTGLHGTIHPSAYANEPAASAGYRLNEAPVDPRLDGREDDAWLDAELRQSAPMRDVPRSRRPLYLMAGIVALGVAGIGASFAYKSSKSGSHEIATIMAQSGPTKVQPDQPGGVDVPNQDASILDRSSQPTPVALASHEEQPVDLSTQPTSTKAPPLSNVAADGAATGAASVPVPVPPGGQQHGAPGQAGWQSYGIGAMLEPKKVKTVSVRSDGTLLPNDTPPQMAATMPTGTMAPAHPTAQASETTPKPTVKSTARVIPMAKPASTPQSIEQLASTDTPAETTPAKPKPAAAKPVKVASAEQGQPKDIDPAAPAGSGFAVQFAAPASEQEAHELTAKLTQKFSGQLSGHRLTYHRAKIGEKTVFRVRSSGLSKEEAASICQKVQSGGGSCFVAKD